MKPTLGRIVLYVLTAADAESINASRGDELTPQRGNRAEEGQIFPSMVVAVWADGENPPTNLKVQLDGTDAYWATSRHMSDDKTPGTWHWMEYQKAQAGMMPAPPDAIGYKADCAGTAMDVATGIAALPVANEGEPSPEQKTTEEAPAENTEPAATTEQTPEELEKLKEESGF